MLSGTKRSAPDLDKEIKVIKLEEDSPTGELSDTQKSALRAVRFSDRNLFVTGGAGTGKSHLLKFITRELEDSKVHFELTATTGTAGLLIGGKTFHSAVGLGLCDKPIDKLSERVMGSSGIFFRRYWRGLQVLIIDEISMMDPELFSKVENLVRTVRGGTRPFGGLRVIVVGDFYQLPPVNKKDPNKLYDGTETIYCFQTAAWERMNFEIHNLRTVHRQTDSVFINLLNNIRIGKLSVENIELLRTRIDGVLDLPKGIEPTTLVPLLRQAQITNSARLSELGGEAKSFIPETYLAEGKGKDMVRTLFIGDGPKRTHTELTPKYNVIIQQLAKACPVPEILSLKVGAQVILTVNLNVREGLVNGSRGVVESFDPQGDPIVSFGTTKLPIKRFPWKRKLSKGKYLCYAQYPLILGWALTIHRSQGMTLKYAKLSVGSTIFAIGQLYVAFSRVQKLEDLALIDFDPTKVMKNEIVDIFYNK